METKEELVQKIKEWIDLDNEILEYQNKLKKKKTDKKNITQLLIETMKKNDIDCVDIKDGSLLYKKKKQKESINKKLLLQTLTEYYKNQNKAEEISEFILNNRKEKVLETIKRKII